MKEIGVTRFSLIKFHPNIQFYPSLQIGLANIGKQQFLDICMGKTLGTPHFSQSQSEYIYISVATKSVCIFIVQSL